MVDGRVPSPERLVVTLADQVLEHLVSMSVMSESQAERIRAAVLREQVEHVLRGRADVTAKYGQTPADTLLHFAASAWLGIPADPYEVEVTDGPVARDELYDICVLLGELIASQLRSPLTAGPRTAHVLADLTLLLELISLILTDTPGTPSPPEETTARFNELHGEHSAITEAVLPLSGTIVQWRQADRRYRVLPAREAEDDIGWHKHTGSPNLEIRVDGDVWRNPSWVVAWGEAPPNAAVEVLRADGTPVAVTVLGAVWIAEWVGHGEPVTVRYGDAFPWTLRIPRPDYLT